MQQSFSAICAVCVCLWMVRSSLVSVSVTTVTTATAASWQPVRVRVRGRTIPQQQGEIARSLASCCASWRKQNHRLSWTTMRNPSVSYPFQFQSSDRTRTRDRFLCCSARNWEDEERDWTTSFASPEQEDDDDNDDFDLNAATIRTTNTNRPGPAAAAVAVDWFESYYNNQDEPFPSHFPPKPRISSTKTANANNKNNNKNIDTNISSDTLHTHCQTQSETETDGNPTAATATTATTSFSKAPSPTELLHPHQFCVKNEATGQFRIPYPKSLSPTAILEFKRCPQSFLFQYILGIRQPTNAALAKGSMCHTALEQVFDLEPHDRTLTTLQNLFRTAWSQHRQTDDYKDLFDGCREREAAWGREGLALLENYWQQEDASTVTRPNPVQREVWVSAALPLDPTLGVTAKNAANGSSGTGSTHNKDWLVDNVDPSNPPESFRVRGIIDRLDMVQGEDGSSRQVALRLIDYKSSKKPNFIYSPAANARIRAEKIEQLLIYALLLRESGGQKHGNNSSAVLPLRYLRLFYLGGSAADFIDFDLGATADERDAKLHRVHVELAAVWRNVRALVDEVNNNIDNNNNNNSPLSSSLHAFVGCDKSFCFCHECRPRFAPGTVWQPPAENPLSHGWTHY